jgi:hypothetical protein
MKVKMTELERLALDVYQGKAVNYNQATGDDALRNLVTEAVGGEWNFKNFRENKYRVFSIIEEAVDITLGTIITNQFDSFADVRNAALGDELSFRVEDASLFRVARIAAGDNDLRRQKLLNGRFSVDTDWYGVKIYTEFDLFVAGRINWSELVNRITSSFTHFVGQKTYDAIIASYSALNATYGIEGTMNDDKLSDLVSHIEAKSGKTAVIMGTKKALRAVSKSLDLSDSGKDKLNTVGYVGDYVGTPLVLLPQAHKVGTDEFAVDDKTLIVIPSGEKIVKIVIEGEARINETAGYGERNDQQMEYEFQKKLGLSVFKTSIYGMYKIQ